MIKPKSNFWLLVLIPMGLFAIIALVAANHGAIRTAATRIKANQLDADHRLIVKSIQTQLPPERSWDKVYVIQKIEVLDWADIPKGDYKTIVVKYRCQSPDLVWHEEMETFHVRNGELTYRSRNLPNDNFVWNSLAKRPIVRLAKP